MAIKHIFCRGIGFNATLVGWVVTRGFGAVGTGGGGGGGSPGAVLEAMMQGVNIAINIGM